MIEATVRYRSDFVGTDVGVLHDLSDRIESTIGIVLAEEMDHIEVTLSPYGPADEYGKYASGVIEQAIFIKIDMDAHHVPSGAVGSRTATLTDALSDDIKQIFGAHAPRPRVWVRPIVGGSFAE